MPNFTRDPYRLTILAGIAYFVIGYGSAALDPSVSNQMRFAWRLTAWVLSGVVYAAHLIYAYFRLSKSALPTALHAGLAVALGAFLLAAAATMRAALSPSHVPYGQFLLALVVWPLITAVPAFVVALAVAVVLSRFPKKGLAE
jgi:hypothetical protein